MKSRVKNSFNRAAATYSQAAKLQKKIASATAEYIPAGFYNQVLEIGAGQGLSSSKLLSRINCNQYIALDIAPNMLYRLKHKFPDSKCLVADGEQLPFIPKSFDLIFSSSCMQWYSNPASIAGNIKLLKTGGYFALSIFVAGTFSEMREISQKTGFGNLWPLHSSSTYQQIITTAHYESKEISYTLWYDNVLEFLKEHQQTGARSTNCTPRPNKKGLKNFCQEYEKKFSHKDKIPVTYNIFYAWGTVPN